MSHPWLGVLPVAVAAAMYALVRLLALLIALRGTEPADRPEILRALGELFGRGGGEGPRLRPPDGPDQRP
jgi:hypothetical protein